DRKLVVLEQITQPELLTIRTTMHSVQVDVQTGLGEARPTAREPTQHPGDLLLREVHRLERVPHSVCSVSTPQVQRHVPPALGLVSRTLKQLHREAVRELPVEARSVL